MVFAVVVDVPPLEAAAAARTLSTCNAALGPDQCVLADADRSSARSARWYAVVRFGPDGQGKLSIELYERDLHGSRVASSELQFEERDSLEERWASAGVVVAALVLAQPTDHERAEPTPKPVLTVAAKPPTPVGPVNAPSAPPWLRLDLGATFGSELRSAPLRVGPFARVGLAFEGVPVFACASGAYTIRSSANTDLSWVTGSLGAGVRWAFAHQRAALELRTEAVLETIGIQASDGEHSESARRTRFGPRFGLDLSGYLVKNWALLLGAEAGVLGPRVVIDAAGQREELPPFVWGVLAAIRYDFR